MADERSRSALMTRRLKPSTAAGAAAADVVRQAGLRWAMADQVTDDAAIVARILVLHSVRHARSELRLSLGRLDSDLMVEVEDTCTSSPNGYRGSAIELSGLKLVAGFAAHSGCDLYPTGRRLWALVGMRTGLPALPVG